MNGNHQGQRTFIYLRQLAGGRESGYARAEWQDRAVELHIAVQGFAPQQESFAFAVMEDGVLLLGRLMLDARGQGGLSAQLSRQEYERIQVLFILREAQEGAQIPLAGTPGHSGRVNWEAVKVLALQALHPAQENEPDEAAEQEEEPVQETTQETAPEERTPEPVQEEQPEAEPADEYDAQAQEEPFLAVERELRTPIRQEERVELPQLLRNAYWPQQLWPLHDLFERFEEAKPFPQQTDCAYIRVPLDGTYGAVAYYLVGARVSEGWVTAVGYLIPGEEAKPIGIAGSEYADGYWQLWQYAQGAE